MIEFCDLKRCNESCAAEIQEALRRTAASGRYLRGEETSAFEEEYASYIGTQHCVGCGNGLDALTLIFRAYIELGAMHEGDEVIVPANTYIASMIAVSRCRLTPVLVEPSIDTLQIDDKCIEEAVTPRTRAIMIVHLYGRCAYTKQIERICRECHLLLVEDNAQAHGCRYYGDDASSSVPRFIGERPESAPTSPADSSFLIPHSTFKRTGSLGSAAAHSFYPTKNIGALGDAGAVTTDDKDVADTVRKIANYGMSQRYVFRYVGINSRIDELQAAVLRVKLRHIEAWNARRRAIAAEYIRRVRNPFITLPSDDYWQNSVFHIFPALCKQRDELRRRLAADGIQTDVHYPSPPHRQRCYPQWHALELPITERIHREEVSLPVNHALTAVQVDEIIRSLNDFTPQER